MRSRFKMRVWNAQELPPDWFKRKATDGKDSVAVENSVREIINSVRKRGDAALVEYTEKFDKTKLNPKDLRVTSEEIKATYKAVSKEQVAALKLIK